MTTSRPSDEDVETAFRSYISAADVAGRDVTIAEFASHIGLKRPTLYSRFPGIVAAISDRKHVRAGTHKDKRQERIEQLEVEKTEARRAESEARRQVRVLANQVRSLTLENAELTKRLESIAGVTPLRKSARD